MPTPAKPARTKAVRANVKVDAKVMAENSPGKSSAKPRAKSRTTLTAAEVEQIFRRFAHITPEPKGELESVNDYTLLVAVVLSAQATDAGVNKATRALFKVAATPSTRWSRSARRRCATYIKTIGLYPQQGASNVIALSQKLDRRARRTRSHADRDALESAAGCRAQDRQRGHEHGVRASRRWRSTRTCSASPTASASPNAAKTPLDTERATPGK